MPLIFYVKESKKKVKFLWHICIQTVVELLPRFVPENMRFACCAKDCTYITIDEAMLLYHIKALHKELRKYKCPHCPNVSVPFAEIGHHLRCHGELLFKCGHCAIQFLFGDL